MGEIEESAELHKYSFEFEVENNTSRKFKDVMDEIYFPVEYRERKEWTYPHAMSSASADKPGYLCVALSYSYLSETAKRQFGSGLLPGKRLKIFSAAGGWANLFILWMTSDGRIDSSMKCTGECTLMAALHKREASH